MIKKIVTKLSKKIAFLSLSILCGSLGGCSTLVILGGNITRPTNPSSKFQTLDIESMPSYATCQITSDKEKFTITTPSKVRVLVTQSDLHLKCFKGNIQGRKIIGPIYSAPAWHAFDIPRTLSYPSSITVEMEQ